MLLILSKTKSGVSSGYREKLLSNYRLLRGRQLKNRCRDANLINQPVTGWACGKYFKNLFRVLSLLKKGSNS